MIYRRSKSEFRGNVSTPVCTCAVTDMHVHRSPVVSMGHCTFDQGLVSSLGGLKAEHHGVCLPVLITFRGEDAERTQL